MKTFYTLKFKIDGEDKIIYFGMPDNKEEINGMFKLRFDVYSVKNYINPDNFPEKLEIDSFDKKDKCFYFIAKIDEKIIGTTRLIKDDFLPTEKECFSFKEPKGLANIPRDQRAELGRLIVIPYDKEKKKYLPRNLVTLFLFKTLVLYGNNNNLKGGYAFITTKFKNKLEKLGVPIHLIDQYKQIYPESGILFGYFNNESDKIVPLYYITKEFEDYLKKTLDQLLICKQINSMDFVLSDGLYAKFLKLMKII